MPALDFAAAAPWTYDHWVGGGTWEDKTIGRGKDVVESLQGGDFKSGQLVSYFLEIDTSFLPEQKNDQAIQVELGFLASTTGQSGVGQDWIQNIQVNYDSERVTYGGDGTPATKTGPGQYEDNPILTRTNLSDTANQGPNNDGGSYVEFLEQRFESRDGTVKLGNDSQPAISTDLGPLSNISYGAASISSGNNWLYDEQMVRLTTTFNVYDLDVGEKPVVRIDVHLGDNGWNPTGNLQGFLLDAEVITPTTETTTINTGRQTVPFKITKDLELTPPTNGLKVEKYVTDDTSILPISIGNVTGFSDEQALAYLNENRNKSITVQTGSTVRYIYKITNTGTVHLNDISLYDDNNIDGSGFGAKDIGAYSETQGQTTTNYENVLLNPLDNTAQYAGDFSEYDFKLLDYKAPDVNYNGTDATDFSGDAFTPLTVQGSSTGEVIAIYGFDTLATDGTVPTQTNKKEANDLSAGSTAYVVYEVTNVIADVDNEVLVVASQDPNGGGQQGVTIAGTDSASVKVVTNAPQNGSIRGMVYIDLDGNFDRDANETGLGQEGYVVELFKWDGASSYVSQGTQATDKHGRYFFGDLAAGTYQVEQTSNTTNENVGYIKSALVGKNSDGITDRVDATPDGSSLIKEILIGNADNGYDYDFGIPNTTSGISGRTFEDTNNNGLIDGNDRLLVGVTVELWKDGALSETTTTDANGNYTFKGLTDGTYEVREIDPEYYDPYLEKFVPYINDTQKKDTGAVDFTDDLNIITGFTINNGDGADYFVENNFGEVPPVSLQGYVYWDKDPDGAVTTLIPDNSFDSSFDAGIAGVEIQLTGTDDQSNSVNLSTFTDANGFYYFASLRPSDAAGYTITEVEPGDGTLLDSEDVTKNPVETASDAYLSGVNVGSIDFTPSNLYGAGTTYLDNNNDGVGDTNVPGDPVTAYYIGDSDYGVANPNGSGSDTISGIKITDFGTGGTEYNFGERTPKGLITVVKKVTGADADLTTDFQFDNTGDTTPDFTLDVDSNDNTYNNSQTFLLNAGSYNISELNIPTNWTLSAIDFVTSEETGDTSSVNPGSALATLDLDANEHIIVTFTNDYTAPAAGSITVVKEANPIDGTDFNFTTTGTGLSAFILDVDNDLTYSNTKDFSNLTAGSYTITESALTGWNLDNIIITGDTDNGSVIDLANRTVTIDLDADENLEVKFVNDKIVGSIAVTKVANPADGTDFSFTSTGTGLSGFSLDVDADGTLPDNTIFNNLNPGSYTITETALAGWSLDNIVITGDTDNGSVIDLANRTVTIDLDAKEDIGITFTNNEDTNTVGNISVTKVANPADGTDFNFTTTGLSDFTLDVDGGADNTYLDTQSFNNLTAGSYTIIEAALGGWSLADIGITGDTDNGSVIDLTNREVTIDLDAGENIGITFTNNKQGSISVTKVADPADGTDFGFTMITSTESTFTLDVDGGADNTYSDTQSFNNLAAGNYFIAEDELAGWNLEDISITGDLDGGSFINLGNRSVNVDLDDGEAIGITFTNNQTSSLTVKKQVDYQDGTDFSFTGTNGLGTFSLDVDNDPTLSNTKTFSDIASGTYVITEDSLPTNWSLQNISITGDTGATASTIDVTNRQITVELDPGENVKVTYLNDYQLGTLSGKVYYDENDNGFYNVGEGFISGATVELFLGGVSQGTKTTGSDGKYLFDGLVAGTYTIREEQPSGYDDGTDNVGTYGGTIVNANPLATTYDEITGIELPAGGQGINYDFGEIQTTPPEPSGTATIGGKVFADLDNDGVRDVGFRGRGAEPLLSGVQISLVGDNGSSYTTTTASDGTYLFSDLAAGTYTITETQPTNYDNLRDVLGTIDGMTSGINSNPTDDILQVTVADGKSAINYNFLEGAYNGSAV